MATTMAMANMASMANTGMARSMGTDMGTGTGSRNNKAVIQIYEANRLYLHTNTQKDIWHILLSEI